MRSSTDHAFISRSAETFPQAVSACTSGAGEDVVIQPQHCQALDVEMLFVDGGEMIMPLRGRLVRVLKLRA